MDFFDKLHKASDLNFYTHIKAAQGKEKTREVGAIYLENG